MKVKIQEIVNIVTPKYQYNGIKDIFTLKIFDKIKYNILPVKIKPPNTYPSFLIFYDGITSATPYEVAAGRYSSPRYDNMGARFMPFVQTTDPYYLDPTRTTGWTAGSPFYYVTYKEVQGLVESLKLQGVTTTTSGYAYINWFEDSREFILYNGYTGPVGASATAEHQLLSKTLGKILTGGTGVDGISFYGLKHYFPGMKWGYYNEPASPYYYGEDVSIPRNSWDQERLGGITAIMEHAADVFLSATDFVDAIDILMPSVYSSLNSRDFNKVRSRQAVTLCKIINKKLAQQGKQPKDIIPFVSPIFLTEQTSTPYTVHKYMPTFPDFQYTPPETIMLDSDFEYEQVDPVVRAGADGAMIWLSNSYRILQVTGRGYTLDEDIILGSAGWRYGPTAGVTNPWSFKSVSRQAVVAHEAYIHGVCMGVTGNRWWWQKEVPGLTAYIPPEWLPLSINHKYPEAGATSGITAYALVEKTYENLKYRAINVLKDVSQKYYNNG